MAFANIFCVCAHKLFNCRFTKEENICDDIIIIKDKNIYLKGDVKTLLERKDPYFMSLLGKEYEE